MSKHPEENMCQAYKGLPQRRLGKKIQHGIVYIVMKTYFLRRKYSEGRSSLRAHHPYNKCRQDTVYIAIEKFSLPQKCSQVHS